ncbi:PilZ domain-containing protein [Pseudobdellovibrio exovorus]|uniref:PilZ domain-containing protein n=1 Tax=Pseudobdellovibrio exovorus JSS TaxID=1184267 RepID=M4V9Z4_9BACT|nr:PilZ domain-containing protein [Pseudobdellovibrio exovorus]AGH96013.1 hypothetical protein A11Q_1797 [Pseudobdellovibrio exovorus JSS]
MSSTWALHNALKAWTLYNLSESELRLLLLGLSENELKLAKICKKQDSEWQRVDKTQHAGLLTRQGLETYSSAEGYPAVHHDVGSACDTEYFVIKPNKVIQPRLHKRYEIVVPCTLVGSKEFLTETIDLSEGGLYFKDIIPSFIAGYFLVIVDGRYRLMCSLVEDQKEKKRVQIVSEESDAHFVQYKAWLSTL